MLALVLTATKRSFLLGAYATDTEAVECARRAGGHGKSVSIRRYPTLGFPCAFTEDHAGIIALGRAELSQRVASWAADQAGRPAGYCWGNVYMLTRAFEPDVFGREEMCWIMHVNVNAWHLHHYDEFALRGFLECWLAADLIPPYLAAE